MNKLVQFLMSISFIFSGTAYGMCVNNQTNISVNAAEAQKLISDFIKGKKFTSTSHDVASCKIEISPSPMVLEGIFMVTIEEYRMGFLLNSISTPISTGMSGTGDCATKKPYTLSSGNTDNIHREILVDLGTNPEGAKNPFISVTNSSSSRTGSRSSIGCALVN